MSARRPPRARFFTGIQDLNKQVCHQAAYQGGDVLTSQHEGIEKQKGDFILEKALKDLQ